MSRPIKSEGSGTPVEHPRAVDSAHAVPVPEVFRLSHYLFRRAETPHELEQVHRLNYRTFVGEIPQHADPGTGYLIDKFHDKNQYFVALRDGRVIGMVAVHDQAPFSVTDR